MNNYLEFENIQIEELALQRKRYAHLSDEEWRWMLQQVDGRQRTRSKLPTFAQISDWWYPIRLSCEQCSSEVTAQYKAQLIGSSPYRLIDLTGGYGVDTYFLSEHAKEAHYVEQNAELCRIASHNFSLTRKHIQVHNTTAQEFLASQLSTPTSKHSTLVYIDPARRSASGNKVFRIEDCEPNITQILLDLRKIADTILIKFSPMLDITAALQSLGNDWDIHIVALQNEVKEVLFISGSGMIHTANIYPHKTDLFTFTREAEKNASSTIVSHINQYLYEPNAAIIKAGAFRLIAERYQVEKLDNNTHLYTSNKYIESFPGRCWEIIASSIKDVQDIAAHNINRAAIVTRNYPLSPEQLRKKLKLRDSDLHYLIGARVASRPTLLLAKRVH